MNRQIAESIVRHVLTKGSGALVTYGLAVPQDKLSSAIDVATGIVLFLGTLAWSAWQKRKASRGEGESEP